MLLQSIAVFLVTTGIIVTGEGLQLPWLRGMIVPAVLLWTPFLLVSMGKIPFDRLGIKKPEITDVKVTAVAFVPILLLYPVFWTCILKKEIILPAVTPGTIASILVLFLTQTAGVAIPEELFFRGYIQGTWQLHFKNAGFIPILAGATLFALLHYANTPSLSRLEVFFPALLFGFLKWKTGNIVSPVLCHSLCNVLHYVLSGQMVP